MKVVLANKFWFPRGGAERHVFELAKMLEAHGDTVVPFAMCHPRDLHSPFERDFVSEIRSERVTYDWQGLRTVGRMMWSFEAARKAKTLVGETQPDIFHAHNIYHQLSPSILGAAQSAGVPVVMTLHDQHLVSPNYNLSLDGRAVELDPRHPYFDTLRRRLVDHSLLKSAVSAFEGWLHRTLRAYEPVRTFIAPSQDLRDRCVRFGVDPKKLVVLPHFIDLRGKTPVVSVWPRVLFVGRLSAEKGVLTLIHAMELLPEAECVIVGDGPDAALLHDLVRKLGLVNVRFTGALQGAELEREYADARVVAVPSVCPEVFGLAALEAYAWGKPVVASHIGGLPEVVHDGETGYLFEPGNAQALADKLAVLVKYEPEARRLGKNGRHLAEIDHNPEVYYHRLKEIYEKARK
jgi:glycosyltransferase involved in cell wall biosynthesis